MAPKLTGPFVPVPREILRGMAEGREGLRSLYSLAPLQGIL